MLLQSKREIPNQSSCLKDHRKSGCQGKLREGKSIAKRKAGEGLEESLRLEPRLAGFSRAGRAGRSIRVLSSRGMHVCIYVQDSHS